MPLSDETSGDVNRKTRRGQKRKHKFENKLRIVGVNSNGVSSKLHSLDHVMKTVNPSVLCIQETKLRKAGKIKNENSKNFVIFELTRKYSHGGGLAILVKPELHPVFVSEGDDQVEILVVQIRVENLQIRIINAYGPQECDVVSVQQFLDYATTQLCILGKSKSFLEIGVKLL